MTLLAIVASGACLLALPRSSHTKAAFGVLLGVGIVAAAALWWLVALAAQMPPGPTELGEDLLALEVLVTSEDHALLRVTGGLARLTPDAELQRLPHDSEIGVVHQAVARGELAAFAGRRRHGETFVDYLALVGPGGFVLDPDDHVASPGHGLTVTRDGERLLVVETDPQTELATLSTLEDDGTLTRRESRPVGDLRVDAACLSGGDLYLLGPFAAHRVEEGERRELTERGVTCPGARKTHRLRYVLTRDGISGFHAPRDGEVLLSMSTHYGDGKPELRGSWITPRSTSLFALSGGRTLEVETLSEDETAAYGFADDAAHYRLRDVDDATLGEAFVARWLFAGVKVFERNETLLVVDQGLDHRVLLDAATLERLDSPDAVTSVRERLGVWGGRSLAYEVLLALALALGLLVWFLLPFFRGERVSRQRVLALTCSVLLVALLHTAKRLFLL